VDGEDYPTGQKALIEYARTWKVAGVESRKQYVLVQDSIPALTCLAS
jgi:hypothetical protein